MLPRDARDRLGSSLVNAALQADDGVLIDKPSPEADEPFASLSEWSRAADDKAYRAL